MENWIPEGVANPGQVGVSSDEKKKGFILGFPTSNKRWKNSWFFTGGEWGRDVPASSRRNFSAKRVPRHFTSPSQTVPVLLDGEISHLAAAVVLPLDERGRSFLLEEEKMIAQRVFTRLPARLPRLCDFDTVCDLQARAVKNSEAASKRHAAGLAKKGIASPDGDDLSDGEETGDITGRGVESGASKGKRSAEGTPDHAARPPKRASKVVQYVVSSDEEGADEPVLAETPSAQTATHEGPAEGANAAVPSSEEVNELHVPASTPPQTASPSRVASPLVAMGEPDVSLDDVELAENYKYGNKVSREIKRLREHASVLAAEKLSAEESYAQQLAQLRESTDDHLSAQIAVEEKFSAAEEEVRLLKEQLSARLEAERVAEEAKEKAEPEALDLRNQLSSRELIFDNLKAVLEAEAVDRFKRSPAYDTLLLREFERGMRQSKKFFTIKDHSNKKALRRFDRSLQQHMTRGVGSIKEQIKRWKAHCRYNRTEPHPMHLEIPSKRAFNTYYSGQKGSFSGSGAEPDLGHVAGKDYRPFMPDGDEEVTWPSEEEIEDEEDSEGPPAAS
ncbi:hypothetical protein LWI29_001793 [Acer saccharum]|uniref:Uncharacterized protein n=1 Tax=Acer saccharum TaxID=4024 RepID=A0AA39VHV8_ACESA|nr:hypothetical protein LWI29_001793 [Acer saccharum]